MAAFLKKHMPTGGTVEEGDTPKVMHTVSQGENVISIAQKYLSISELYTVGDLMFAINKKNPAGIAPGKQIVIGDDAWIAAGAFIGPGVTIGAGAVVGARAVVMKDVPPWTVVAGNPAKFISKRVLAS